MTRTCKECGEPIGGEYPSGTTRRDTLLEVANLVQHFVESARSKQYTDSVVGVIGICEVILKELERMAEEA